MAGGLWSRLLVLSLWQTACVGAHDDSHSPSVRTASNSEADVCWTPVRYFAPEVFPWIETVHVVSMTHYDAAGWGPPSIARDGDPAETTQENSGKYTRDVCDSYTGSREQASGGYLAAALAVAQELRTAPPPPPPEDKCFPGHARSTAPADYDCRGWQQGFNATQCEAVGCCVDTKLYPNRSNGWCYPAHIARSTRPEFVYSTHPWIVQEYFNYSASCGSSNRNTSFVAAVERGIKTGTIAWHAKPFTIIHELADPTMYLDSLNIAKRLNAQFGVSHGTVAGKMTDLPGVSIGIVPLLAKAGVKALHIGTNGQGNQVFASFPDQNNLPPVFRWRHPTTGDEIIVMNEQGYGRHVVLPRGFGISSALRWQFTGDNEQPPTAEMVQACWNYSAHSQFPNANLKASTLDEFAMELWKNRDKLPIVSQEIGNAWLPQMATDTWRLRIIRAVSRMRNEWVSNGKIQAHDPDLLRYQSRLLIPIEHNFGMSVSKVINRTDHQTCWTNGCFHRKLATGGDRGSTGCATYGGNCDGYDGLAEFARERNSFLYPLPAAPGINAIREESKTTDDYAAFAEQVNKTIAELSAVPSIASLIAGHTNRLLPINISDSNSLTLQTRTLHLQFDKTTGAISSLVQSIASAAEHEWVGNNKRLGQFVYRTYTQQHDIDRFVSQFTPDYAGVYPNHANRSNDYSGACWNKPGMDDAIRTDPAMSHLSLDSISRTWNVNLSKAWKGESNSGKTMLLQLALPSDAVELFGGMREILLNVTALESNQPGVDEIELALSWTGKTATRLAESSWLSFDPSLPPSTSVPSNGWTLDVLGNPLDPMSVAFNGSRHFHAVHRGVCYEGPVNADRLMSFPRMAIETADTPFVAPGDTAHLINFDNSMPNLDGGMHFNLHNNAGWDCSAPWWNSDDAFFRFRVRMEPHAGVRGACWE